MSSKKKARERPCPGCHIAVKHHSFGTPHKVCSGPDEAEDSHHEEEPRAASTNSTGQTELLHAVRLLSEQVGALQLEHKALSAKVNTQQLSAPSASSVITGATGINSDYNYVDLVSFLTKTNEENDNKEKGKARIQSFDHWLEAWSAYERNLVEANPSMYKELSHYRQIIQRANRKFRWNSVYDFDVQFRLSLSHCPGKFDQIDTTLYTTILDSSAVRKDGSSCQRCKSDHHLVRDCPFRARSALEESKGAKKADSAADQWKFEKWYHHSTEGCNLFQRRACQKGKECKRAHVCKACRGEHSLADCKIATTEA